MNRDRYDLPLTTASDRAAALYRDGIDCILAAWHGADAAFDAAIAEDPDFALAHVARARVHQINMEGAAARDKATRARQLAATASRREQQHVEIVALVVESQTRPALQAAEQHLTEFPRDALILSLLLGAFGLYAFSGRPDHDAARLSICERYAADYGEDWWFLTYLGWSRTEAGDVVTGRDTTERAYWMKPANASAAHALSHALFEQGDPKEGRTFLSGWLPAHDRVSFLQGHLAWHLALIALEDGDTDGALDIYERHIRPQGLPYPPLNILTDTTSLLWRVSLGEGPGLTRIGRKSPPTARNSSRRPGRILPMSITHWLPWRATAALWSRGLPKWRRGTPRASWRPALPRSVFAAVSGHLPRATTRAPCASSSR